MVRSKRSLSCLQNKWEVWLVLIFSFFYYASYYRCGLNLGGEGGTAGVIALRLLEGQRPIVDTFLGYNVLWFYPVAGLFKIFGPNYLILKIYFFVICTVTALLATCLVRRATGSSVLAAGTGLLLALIPGMQFRNYMAFLSVLNMVTLLQVFVFPHKVPWQRGVWRGAAGLALAITYLIRIDVGFFVTGLVLALLFVFPWSTNAGPIGGLAIWGKSVATIGIFVLVLHIPFVWDARHRGFETQFLGQYTNWISYLRYKVEGLRDKQPETPPFSAPPQLRKVLPSSSETLAETPQKKENGTLDRAPISDIFHADKLQDRAFVWTLYSSIPIAVLILIGFGTIWFAAALARDFEACQRALGVLIALGCALALFPQYFFFRPDTPHLSEFMVPFMVVLVLACSTALRIAKARKGALAWGYAVVLLSLCIPDIAAHLRNGFHRESSGSIAARKKCRMEFAASNGVRVRVREKDFPIFQGIYSAVTTHSIPSDWVVCYPYSPTINFMTNRRSYEFNLYVDNATAGPNFDAITIEKLNHFRPAVVVVDNRAINRSEHSRFRNWAAPTYKFIKTHYHLVGTYGLNEVYSREAPKQGQL